MGSRHHIILATFSIWTEMAHLCICDARAVCTFAHLGPKQIPGRIYHVGPVWENVEPTFAHLGPTKSAHMVPIYLPNFARTLPIWDP